MTDACEADAEHNVSITPSTPVAQQPGGALQVDRIEGHDAPPSDSDVVVCRANVAASTTPSARSGVVTPVQSSRVADRQARNKDGNDMPLTPWQRRAPTTVTDYDGVDLLAALRERDEELLQCRLTLQSWQPRCLELEARCHAAEEEAMRWHLTLMQERERQRTAASTLAQEAIRLEADVTPLRRERAALQESVQQLQRDVAAHKAAQDAQQESLRSLQSKLTASEWAKRQAEAEVRRLRGEIERWTRTCQETAREQVRLESANLRLQAQLSETQRRLQSALVQAAAAAATSTTAPPRVQSQETQTTVPPPTPPPRGLVCEETPSQSATRCVDDGGGARHDDAHHDDMVRRLRAELQSQRSEAEEARRQYVQACEAAAAAVAQETAARRSVTEANEAWAHDVAAVMTTVAQHGQTLSPTCEVLAKRLRDVQDESVSEGSSDGLLEDGRRRIVMQKLGWVVEALMAELRRAISTRDEAARASAEVWQHRCRAAQEEIASLQSRIEKMARAQHSRVSDQAQRTEALDELLRKIDVLVHNALREHGKRRERMAASSAQTSRLFGGVNTSSTVGGGGSPADRLCTASTAKRMDRSSAHLPSKLPSSSSVAGREAAAPDMTRDLVQTGAEDARVAMASSTYSALLALLDAMRELKAQHRALQQKHTQHVAQSASSQLLAQKRLAEAEEELTRQTRRGELAVQRARETQTECARELQARCEAAEARATTAAREVSRTADDLAAARQRAEVAEGKVCKLQLELTQRDKEIDEMRAANARLDADRTRAEAELTEWQDGMRRAMQAAESHAACTTQAGRRADILYDGLMQCVRFIVCCIVRHRQLLGVQYALQVAASADRRELRALHLLIRALRVPQDGSLLASTGAEQQSDTAGNADAEETAWQVGGDASRGGARARRWRVAVHVVTAVRYMQQRLQCHERLLCQVQVGDTEHAAAAQTLLDLLSYPLAHLYSRRLQRQVLPCIQLPPAADLSSALGAARDDSASDGVVLRALLASVSVVTQSEANTYCGVDLLPSLLARPSPTDASLLARHGDLLARGEAATQLRHIVREARRAQAGLRDKLQQVSHDLDAATAQNARLTDLLRREEAGRRAIKEDIVSLEEEMRSRPGRAELEGLRTSLQEALRAVGDERAERRALEERLARQQHREGDLLAAQVRLKNEVRSLSMELAQARYGPHAATTRPLQIAAEDAFEPMLLRPSRTPRPPVESLMMSTEEGDYQSNTTAARLPTPLQSSQRPPLAATSMATAATTPMSSAAATPYADRRQYRYYDALLRHARQPGAAAPVGGGPRGTATGEDELPLYEPALLRARRQRTRSRTRSPHAAAPHTPLASRPIETNSDVATPPSAAAAMQGRASETTLSRQPHGHCAELVTDLIEGLDHRLDSALHSTTSNASPH